MKTQNSKSEEQIRALWEKGDLFWKLRPVQKRMHKAMRANRSLKFVINSARRLGKSYLLVLMAIEDALKHKNVALRFAAPTQKALKKIILPLMRIICSDMPDEMRPKFNTIDGVFTFPSTKSEIHMAGVNSGHAESLRGTEAFKAYVDEAGFVTDLPYLVEDILMPQLLTTRGQLILSSTPPKTPAHDFVRYANQAELDGNYAKYTIDEAGYPSDIIELFRAEAGGEDSTTWKREYLCEFVVDENYALAPEWKDGYVQEYKRPPPSLFKHLHRYVSMDIGVSDFTAVIFGYYDFPSARLVIEDEIIMHGPKMTTDVLADAIKRKEKELWGDLPVHLRISDNNNLILLQDMGTLHGLHFAPTNKDMLEAMVNNVRLRIRGARVLVHPKAKHTHGCLKNGIWEDNRRRFARSSVYGHFDAFAALMYLVRNLDEQTNPIPALLDVDEANSFVPDSMRNRTPEAEAVKAMLGLTRRI